MRGQRVDAATLESNVPSAEERAARAARRLARASWPVRVFRLGEEPPDDYSGFNVEQRLAIVWQMTCDAWASAGRPMPTYTRSEMPVRVIRRTPATKASDA